MRTRLTFLVAITALIGGLVSVGAGGAQAASKGDISGTVTNSAGQPIEELEVSVYGLLDNTSDGVDNYFWAYISREYTDANGHYFLDEGSTYGGWGGYKNNEVVVRFADGYNAVSYATEYYNDVSDIDSAVRFDKFASTSGIDAVLAERGRITGRVIDVNGDPVENFSVTPLQLEVDDSGDTYWNYVGISVDTEADGTFDTGPLETDTYRLELDGNADFVQEYYEDVSFIENATDIDVVPAGTEDLGDIEVGLGGSISGTISDGSGAGVVGALEVYKKVSSVGAPTWEKYRTKSSDGYPLSAFDMKRLPEGTYRFKFVTSTGASSFYDGADSLDTATDVVLDPGGSVTGIDTVVADPSATAITLSTPPSISGIAQVGETLTVDPGAWEPAGTAFTYQWWAGDAAILSAHAQTYEPVAADVGEEISVQVTASKTGYTSLMTTSNKTDPVIAADPVEVTVGDFVFEVDPGDPDTGATVVGYLGAGGDVVIPGSVDHSGVTYVVTAIEQEVFNDKELISVQIPATVTTIGSKAFRGNELGSVTIPDSVKRIGYYAFGYAGITSLTLGSTSAAKLTSIGVGAFAGNDLDHVTIPDSVEQIGSYAFVTNPLTSVDLGTTDAAKLTSVGVGAFKQNPNLVDVEFAGAAPATITPATDAEPSLGSAAGMVVTYPWEQEVANGGAFTTPTWEGYSTKPDRSIVEVADGDFLVQIDLDNGAATIVDYTGAEKEFGIPGTVEHNGLTYDVTAIGDRAFEGDDLTDVGIPDSVTTIGMYAFSDNQLTRIQIPDAVDMIGAGAFLGNPDLVEVEFEGDAPSSIAGAVPAPSPITGRVHTFAGLAVAADPSLGTNPDLVVYYPWAHDVSNGGGFTMPTWQGYSTQAIATITDGDYVLEVKVSDVDEGATVVDYTGAGGDVVIPDSVDHNRLTYPVTAIAKFALESSQLTGVDIPDTVTSIGYAAFYINELSSVVLPASVTSIERSAFTSNPLIRAEFAGAAPATVTGPDVPGVHPSLGSESGLVVYYHWAYDVSNGGDFTMPTWHGYTTQAIMTVKFDMGGHGSAIPAMDVDKGAAVAEPTAPSDPGWTFTGWFSDSALTTPFDFTAPVEDNVTVHAGWEADVVSSPGAGTTPDPEPTSTRLFGPDRFDTAVAVSKATYAPGVEVAFIANGELFADGLNAGPGAARLGGPLLTVRPDSVPDVIAEELARLQPKTIYIVGGPAVVSAGVKAELAGLTTGDVIRLSGPNRYATAAESASLWGSADTVYVASGLKFADALSGGAAAARSDSPLLLTTRNATPAVTIEALKRLDPKNVVVVGGADVITEAVIDEIAAAAPGAQVRRVGGEDRYETSAKLLRISTDDPITELMLASGAKFADALVAVAASAAKESAFAITELACLPASIEKEIGSDPIEEYFLLGGEAVLKETVLTTTCP